MQAKTEGELVLYTAMQRKVIQDSVEMFQNKYDIEVTYVRKGSGGTIQLIEAERTDRDLQGGRGGPLGSRDIPTLEKERPVHGLQARRR